jgi:hypothetical protein
VPFALPLPLANLGEGGNAAEPDVVDPSPALRLRQLYRMVAVHSLPDALVFAAMVAKLLGAKIMLDLHETNARVFCDRGLTVCSSEFESSVCRLPMPEV